MNYWDGRFIHWSLESGHSTDFKMACGIVLSTWDNPAENRPSYYPMESRVGYTWDAMSVTCPSCQETDAFKAAELDLYRSNEAYLAIGGSVLIPCAGSLLPQASTPEPLYYCRVCSNTVVIENGPFGKRLQFHRKEIRNPVKNPIPDDRIPLTRPDGRVLLLKNGESVLEAEIRGEYHDPVRREDHQNEKT